MKSESFTYNDLEFGSVYGDRQLFAISPKIEINFSNNLFWTTFLQYNTQVENFNINSRLQWRFAPMSDIFLVYTDNYLVETDETEISSEGTAQEDIEHASSIAEGFVHLHVHSQFSVLQATSEIGHLAQKAAELEKFSPLYFSSVLKALDGISREREDQWNCSLKTLYRTLFHSEQDFLWPDNKLVLRGGRENGRKRRRIQGRENCRKVSSWIRPVKRGRKCPER